MNQTVALAVILLSRFLYAAEETAFVITEPTDYQIIQRQNDNTGTLRISGKVNDHSGLLQRRFIINTHSAKLADGGWADVAGQKDAEFHDSFSAPAGGWYRLEFRYTKDGNVSAEHTLEHIGVGDIFVIAGQSNSTNYGSDKQTTSTGLVSSFDGTKWVLANDPQPGTADRSKGGSFAPAFGDALYEKFHVPIGIASTGAGATSVRQWLPKGERMKNPPTIESHIKKVEEGTWESTGDLFDGLMKRIDALRTNSAANQKPFRAILWHQGESDAGQLRGGYPAIKQITGDQYAEFMTKLVKSSRGKAGWEIPWFNAVATYHSEKDAEDPEFRAAQKSLWETGVTFEGPDTDALRKEYRAGVHFNAKGLQAHGKLWAEKVAAWLDGTLDKNKK